MPDEAAGVGEPDRAGGTVGGALLETVAGVPVPAKGNWEGGAGINPSTFCPVWLPKGGLGLTGH